MMAMNRSKKINGTKRLNVIKNMIPAMGEPQELVSKLLAA